MRKLPLFALAMIIAFSARSTVSAQSQPDSLFNPRFGIGIGISNGNFSYLEGYWSNNMPFDLVFPIDVSRVFRLEPTFGFSIFSSDREMGENRKQSLVKYGLGFIYTNKLTNSLQMNVGLRPSILFFKQEVESPANNDYTVSQTVIGVSSTFGGEYYFAPQLSLGVEAQINYASFGDAKVEPSTSNSSNETHTSITTSAHFFVRIYFSR